MASKYHAINGEMVKRIQPRNDQVLIQKLVEKKSAGGIILPNAGGKNDLPTEHGRVIAAGRGVFHQSGKFIEIDLKPGDEVMFQAFPSGVEILQDGEEYLLIGERQVVAKLEAK